MASVEAWKAKDKPNLNQWYRMREADQDFLRIRKDFRSPELKQTFYKVEEFVHSDVISHGLTLAQARDMIKQFTWKKGY